MPYRQQIRVGSRDVDMQRVVASASYLAFVGDLVDAWMRSALGHDFERSGFDAMVKRVELEWHSPARVGELLELTAAIAGWGTTSFTIGVAGHVAERDVFHARAVYVTVAGEQRRPAPTPAWVRAALGEAERLDGALSAASQSPS